MAHNEYSMLQQAIQAAREGEKVVLAVQDRARAVHLMQKLSEEGFRTYLTEMVAKVEGAGEIKFGKEFR